MFRPLYYGEVYGDKEFNGIREARRWCAEQVSEITGTSPEKLLKLHYEQGRIIDVDGERNKSQYKKPLTVERVCPVCGKKFYVRSEKSLKKCCGDECRKKHLREYNTNYMRNRYSNNTEFRAKRKEQGKRNCYRYVEKRKQQNNREIANKIYLLSQEEDAVDLIYLYIYRKKAHKADKFYKELTPDEIIKMERVKTLTNDFVDDNVELAF